MFFKITKDDNLKPIQSNQKRKNKNKNKNKKIIGVEKVEEKPKDELSSLTESNKLTDESKSSSANIETSSLNSASLSSSSKSQNNLKYSNNSNEKKTGKIKFQHQESLIEYGDSLKTSKRGHIIMNLIDTESSYILQLISLLSIYGNKLKDAASQNIIENHIPDVICFQISELIFSHETFFYELRKRAVEFDDETTTIGDVFIQYFSKSFLHKTYSRFITNYDVAKQYIDSSFLHKFLKNLSHEHPQKLTIQDILISPIQRIPRYLLILKDLLIQTPSHHPDAGYLKEAEKVILRLANDLNTFTDGVINYENYEIDYTQVIEMIVGDHKKLFIPNRHFLNWYCIKYIRINEFECKEIEENCYLFLFTDSIFCAKPCPSMEPFKYQRPGVYEDLYLDHLSYSYLWGMTFNEAELIDAYPSKRGSSISQDKVTETPLEEVVKLISEKRKLKLALPDNNIQIRKSEVDIMWNKSNNYIYIIIFNEIEMREIWHCFIKNTLHTHRTGDEFSKITLKYKREVKQLNQPLKFVDSSDLTSNECKNDCNIWACLTDDTVTYSMIISLVPDVQCIITLLSCYEQASCVLIVPGSSFIETDNSGEATKSQDFISQSVDKRNIKSKPNNHSCDNLLEDNNAGKKSNVLQSMYLSEETVVINTDKSKCQTLLECDKCGRESSVWIGSYSGTLYILPSTRNMLNDNRIFKVDTGSCVCTIKYIGGKVIVGLSNGDLMIFKHRLHKWNLTEWVKVNICKDSLNNVEPTINNLLCCTSGKNIFLLSKTYEIKSSFLMSNVEATDEVNLISCKSYFIWISTKLTTVINCHHVAEPFSFIASVDIRNEVAKFLSEKDNGDAISLHKIRGLTITCITETTKYVWIGTSSGLLVVIVKLLDENKNLILPMRTTVLPHGHVGPVRFINAVKHITPAKDMRYQTIRLSSIKGFQQTSTKKEENTLIVTGGEGYHDYNTSLLSSTFDIKNAGQSDSHAVIIVWSILS